MKVSDPYLQKVALASAWKVARSEHLEAGEGVTTIDQGKKWGPELIIKVMKGKKG